MLLRWKWVIASVLAAVPGLAMRVGLIEGGHVEHAFLYGVAIVAGAFLLSWAAEVAQLDVSQGLALSVLALIAVLPEYVVDASFAWLAAERPEFVHYAVANMTGANRLLIGIAWPLVVFVVWLRFHRKHVELEPEHGLELVVLAAASIYAFLMPIKGTISLIDFVVLLAMFAFYMYRVARMPAEEPHLVGPARLVGELPPVRRRTVMGLMAAFSAIVILAVAHPFAEALVETGTSFGIDEFLLVQWVAPLASEAPEFVVVLLFAWRGMSTPALGTLVSSKINQWTLLVGMLPLIYSIALGTPSALPLDTRQQHEVFLTAAQSMFAMALLLNLRLSIPGAASILGLFLIQALIPETRMAVGVVYLVLAVYVLVRTRRYVAPTIKSVWKR